MELRVHFPFFYIYLTTAPHASVSARGSALKIVQIIQNKTNFFTL